MSVPLLSTLIFFPIIASLSLMLVDSRETGTIKLMALIISLLEFGFSLPLWFLFDKTTYHMQFVEQHAWIPTFHINYFLGIDGISVLFILLSTLVTVLAILVSWESIQTKVKEFFIAILFLEGVMIGVFCALDFFLFYIFWEVMLIPMYLIIGVWGGPNRIYATIKFFLYTLIGSLLMLIGIITLYRVGGHTFNILQLAEKEVRALAEEREQTLIFETPDGLPMLNVDPGKVAKALGDLIRNALLYSPTGSSVTVSASNADGNLRVVVKDEGIGLAEADKAHLGEPFWRGDHEAIQKEKGYGLGYAVAKCVIELLGGQVFYDSTFEHGSTFGFTLPGVS